MLLLLVRFSLSRFCWTSVGVQDPTTTPNTQSVKEFRSSTPLIDFPDIPNAYLGTNVENWDLDFSKTSRQIFLKFSPDLLLVENYDLTKFDRGGRNRGATFGGRNLKNETPVDLSFLDVEPSNFRRRQALTGPI